MIRPRYLPFVFKQVWRARTRSGLTFAGVAVAMFLFAGIQAMHTGVQLATQAQADDAMLVVYRKDRYCPFTSQMPQSYEQKIRQIDGVEAVVPIKIVVNNCRTSLDVVTFRGVPREAFQQTFVPRLELVAGSVQDWTGRSDAALLGETLANRRGLSVGDRFEAAGITVYVAGVTRSSEVQDHNVAYVHLDFLQFASGSRSGGIVTQFNVKVADPARMAEVALRIDELFAPAQEPTTTSAEKAFVSRAAADVIEIVGFMRMLGWGCLLAVLALVGNAIVLSVQDRIREHAILQTLGFRSHHVARLIICEGVILSFAGAVAGCAMAGTFLSYSALSLSVEGNSLPLKATPSAFLLGIGIATAAGVLAGLIPAWQASRRDIVSCFRAV
jgi:putative ABC transport system permease protein